MASRTKKRRKAAAFKVSLLGIAGMAPGINYSLAGTTWQDKARRLTLAYTGYDSDASAWQFGNLLRGAVPLVGAMVAKKVLTKLGANRLFNKIPLIGL